MCFYFSARENGVASGISNIYSGLAEFQCLLCVLVMLRNPVDFGRSLEVRTLTSGLVKLTRLVRGMVQDRDGSGSVVSVVL